MKVIDKDAGQLKLRLPDDLKDALKAEAATNARSINGEIVVRLRSTLKGKRSLQLNGAKDGQ